MKTELKTAAPAGTISPVFLKSMAAAGVVRNVAIVGDGADLHIVVGYGKNESHLTTHRGNVRKFKAIGTAVEYLRGIGITTFQINVANWQPAKSH